MKKRLERSLPIKSNLTLDEQVYFIKKTFAFLDDVKERNLIFNNVKYNGVMNKDYGFFTESKGKINESESISLKFNPKGIVTAEIFLEIIDFLDNQKFNRLFTVNITEEYSQIKDNLMNSTKDFENIVYTDKKNFSFNINSSFLYIFRLNKKTMSKKTYIIIFENYILIEIIRKKKKMIIYISI